MDSLVSDHYLKLRKLRVIDAYEVSIPSSTKIFKPQSQRLARMYGPLRSKQGCWTCRLRRKKCDEKYPFCSTCESLVITCYGYGEQKPDWMDNGEKEKAIANSIKQIVKKTSRQKGRLGISMSRFQRRSEPQTDNDAVKIAPKPTNTTTSRSSSAMPDPNAELTPPYTDNGSSTTTTETSSGASPGSTNRDSTPQEFLSLLSSIKTDEAILLMHFVDTVFPLQYPMYRPNILEGGRGWLLSLLLRTKPLYHASMALSAYHRGTILLAASRGACNTYNRVAQEKHLAICLSEFRQAIKSVDHWVSNACPSNGIGLTACIIQLVFFEYFGSQGDAWQIHLRAVTDNFCRLYSKMAMELGLVDSPEPLFDGKTTLVINEGSPPEEAGTFLFLAGVTIWLDILFTITAGKSPRLLSFHPHAVSCASAIKLENIMGCKNWAVLQIGRISALHETKIQSMQQCCFDDADFDAQADNIRQELQLGLAELSLPALELSSHSYPATPGYSNPDIYIITRMFTLAAAIFLYLVVHGYQLETQEMRSLVTEAMMLLRTKIPAHLLPILICPLYIIGSVANADDRQFFRQVFLSPPILDPFWERRGRLLPNLEDIWRMRDSTTGWAWQDTVSLSGQGLLLL